MSPARETWFDRLSAQHTRRQTLKVAAAGAAAAVGASLPFARRPPEAHAATPTDCRKGCVWTTNQAFASGQRTDAAVYGVNDAAGRYLYGPLLGAIAFSFWSGARMALADQAWRKHRSAMQVCFQPFCPGFNPKAPGGPCDGCEPPLFCNPCELVDSGYICCIYDPSDCHGDCCHPAPGCS